MQLTSLLFIFCIFASIFAEDYYDILGVDRQATEMEVRKAFKKKALQLHPDKNQDDPTSQAKFIQLNKAYEVLKNVDLRKEYDLYGEEAVDGSKSDGTRYQSWNYYHDNFGIYDDDIEIVTLNGADFANLVSSSEEMWFINYYHPMCSHCHTLAPAWRAVAQELEGVVRVGAVNCDDEYSLCHSNGVNEYPTLIAYPSEERYNGKTSKEHLVAYILSKLTVAPFATFDDSQWQSRARECEDRPWIVVAADHQNYREFGRTKIKLGAALESMTCLGEVDCSKNKKLCSNLKLNGGDASFFIDTDALIANKGISVDVADTKHVVNHVLAQIPDIPLLNVGDYKKMKKELEERKSKTPRLIIFTEMTSFEPLELRKLPSLVSTSASVSRVRCEDAADDCDQIGISKMPAAVLFKIGGGYDLHHGRNVASDIAAFARDSILAPKFRVLSSVEFPAILQDGSAWFVDFYAPWCPPCMRLLPEFRRASVLLGDSVNFGSVDCTMNARLCSSFNIHQYPTSVLYKDSISHIITGFHSSEELVDFVKDTLDPLVITLDPTTFRSRLENKPSSEIWLVDFYASWCGQCVEMAPEYRKLARLMSDIKNVYVAQVECSKYNELCARNGIHEYPTIMLYPSGHTGTSKRIMYNGWSVKSAALRQWMWQWLPSRVPALDDRSFESLLRDTRPFLVDFYAPWCGPCRDFAPKFDEIAHILEHHGVQFGKVDCEEYRWVCRNAGVRHYPAIKLYFGASSGNRQDIQGRELDTLNPDEIIELVRDLLSLNGDLNSHDEL